MGNLGILDTLQGHRNEVAAAEKAVDKEYPKYVTPDREKWAGAKTVDERNAAKVLVLNEVEHRLVAPHDFDGEAGDGKKGKKGKFTED